MSRQSILNSAWRLAIFAYLFFLSIEAMGQGMKASFKDAVKTYLHENAGEFTELTSFVIGILGTSLVQSSSTVTSLAVKMTQEGVVPLLIAVGIVHGANLGTSVTSSLVAFAAQTPALPKNPIDAVRTLLFRRRLPGFKRAVSTAVVHGMFNALMVTLILLCLELPFGVIRKVSAGAAGMIGNSLAGSGVVLDVLGWVSPKTWTRPLVDGMLDIGLPGWAVVLVGFALLFAALRGFAGTMSQLVIRNTNAIGRADLQLAEIGRKLVGTHPADTFMRGLLLTILVQSSSATTAMVVPLAAMGMFSLRRILPFILGANIGTTTTALLTAASAVGEPGFADGLTIALAHFLLNTLAVVLVVLIPQLRTSVLGATEWLARVADKTPAALLGYLAMLAIVIPGAVVLLPETGAIVLVSVIVGVMLIGPHLSRRTDLDVDDEADVIAAK